MRLQIKRVYEAPARSDGRRILIDRLWPRGVSKEKAQLSYWARPIAASDGLRRWYDHDPSKWVEFRRRYFAELDANPEGVAELRRHLGRGMNTLLFGTVEEQRNNAAALRDYLESGS